MGKGSVGLAVLVFLSIVPVASSHPPAVDPHDGCAVPLMTPSPFPAPGTPVVGTVSYFAPLGTSLSCPPMDPFGNPVTQEWGSHAAACPPPPAWAVPNPHPVPARVMGFHTETDPPVVPVIGGAADVNDVLCV